ncbi:hypothetical protein [Bacillus phage CM1]|nr:hypothetical protein [Bacillus phage CM1]
MKWINREIATIYLKSGKVVEVECDEVVMSEDLETHKLRTLSFKGSTHPKKLYINVDSVECITTKVVPMRVY